MTECPTCGVVMLYHDCYCDEEYMPEILGELIGEVSHLSGMAAADVLIVLLDAHGYQITPKHREAGGE